MEDCEDYEDEQEERVKEFFDSELTLEIALHWLTAYEGDAETEFGDEWPEVIEHCENLAYEKAEGEWSDFDPDQPYLSGLIVYGEKYVTDYSGRFGPYWDSR